MGPRLAKPAKILSLQIDGLLRRIRQRGMRNRAKPADKLAGRLSEKPSRDLQIQTRKRSSPSPTNL